MDRRPIIDDARFIAAVRGERYAVLLARGEVLAACDAAQAALRERLAGLDVVYPRAHLTVASFARGTELRETQAALDRWAGMTAPLTLRLAGVEIFDTVRIPFAAITRSGPLERAYARLRHEARSRGLAPVGGEGGATPPERWIPHLSLAYCGRLDAAGWDRARTSARDLELPEVECLVPAVDLVAYEPDGEHVVGSFDLRAGRRA